MSTLTEAPTKLDLACGNRKYEGFTGIDISEETEADILWDLMETPWPIESDTIEEVVCSHFVEHIPHYRPEFKGVDGWWVFFNELYRVCKPEALLTFVHPYARSERAFWDPTHTRYIEGVTWYYLDKNWRAYQKIEHYHTQCHFEVIRIETLSDKPEEKVDDSDFRIEHYWNVITDLKVFLITKE